MSILIIRSIKICLSIMILPWHFAKLIFLVTIVVESVNQHCGKPVNYPIEEKIVGGYDVGYYKYPWFAALVTFNTVVCGGSLIGPRMILTAAHCYKPDIPLAKKGLLKLENILSVNLGINNFCMKENSLGKFRVQEVIIHELYWDYKPYYDIAILVLEDDTTNYVPICLPPAKFKKPNEGLILGFGELEYRGESTCKLQEARLLIYSDAFCHRMLNKTGNNDTLIYGAFCAGYVQGAIDSCQGDSGGPLQTMTPEGYYVVFGIISFGFQCGKPNLLGFYTDVHEYLDWILNKTQYITETYNLTTSNHTKTIFSVNVIAVLFIPWTILLLNF